MSVPGQRPDTPGGSAAEQSGSALPLVASNSDILSWLDVLLKGKPDQQVLARTEIAMILEARGHTEDAEEAYWTNVQARATDRRAYERLISIYQLKGDRLSESLVQRQLDDVFHAGRSSASSTPETSASNGTSASSSNPASSGAPGPLRTSVKRARRLRSPGPGAPGQPADPDEAAAAQPPAPEPPPLEPPPVTATGPGAAAGHAYARIVHEAMLQAAARTPAPSPEAVTPAPSVAGPAAQPVQAAQSASVPTPAPRPLRPVQSVAVRPQPGPQPLGPQPYEAGPPVRRRPSPLSPHPEPVESRRRFTTSGLIALEPATIGAFLLASFGAAAIIAFLLIAAERGFGSRSDSPAAPGAAAPASAASQLPPRCIDAALRFPAMNPSDPRGSVVAGYRENGVDVDLPRPGGARLTPDQAEQVLGGWMAISLLMERSGQQPPTLAGWLDDETDRPTLANAILAGRRVEGMITPDEWATMRGWPASTCEGAFLNDPRNVGAVRLMERVVAR